MEPKTSKKIVNESRRLELQLNKKKLREIRKLLLQVGGDIERLILAQGANLRREQLEDMKRVIDRDLQTFERGIEEITQTGKKETTELIIDRNGQFLLLVGATYNRLEVLNLTLARISEIKYKDGLTISDRLWRTGQKARNDIANRITVGILQGQSSKKVARDLRKYVISGPPKYVSERLALTEMANAYKLANDVAMDRMRAVATNYKWYVKYELSPRHIKACACEELAQANPTGNGEGIYTTAPNRPHPNCYCLIYPMYLPL